MNQNQPIIKAKNLGVKLGRHQILEDINFEISTGEAIAIIGPNGSGKTVLLKTILGLFPYEGELWLDPAIKIGYVPQRINLDPYLKITVKELFEIKRKLLKLPPDHLVEILNVIDLKKELN